ncbi:hypothetical protein [Chitinophaga sancti]|uniref:Glycosyl hydrolases family 43 n=1 Tax=Chitinophaga sancti TaxID=1004 RepID=A0A1K1M7B8_9BACT|nr:hypothetical protein [Chitinophaga sancti]WQD64651.1 hypothetical protein U0033_09615 [Chitinophaga sancti]WQG89727.1 hypothetical protein SR876_32860 [Chitinophaga sancti]SFW17838.1 hypothetical protein SAMN05661012_00425 [Chitinophaga sancti]
MYKLYLVLFLATGLPFIGCKAQSKLGHQAPAPLFRDPIFDGAADPTLIWNDREKAWWMLYTQRRASVDAENVAYCYGSKIGIAE